MSELVHGTSNVRFFYKIKNIIDSFFLTDCNSLFTLQIPNSTLYRTELICRYISDETEDSFELENFLMLLYMDFIKNSIKNYNPEKVFQKLRKIYYDSDTLIISNGTESYSFDRTNINLCNITISMSKKDIEKGQLILDEIYELYRYRFSFPKLLESLWLNFIDDYKTGDNKKAYQSIIDLLKECFN